MVARVLLLGELVILLYADGAVIYGKTHDAAETLRELPRVGAPAALLWALLFLGADVGLGPWMALFGGTLAVAFVFANWDTLATGINTLIGTKAAVPVGPTSSGGAATK